MINPSRVVYAALYTAARWYVHNRATESAERAAATSVAVVDIEPDSVEWEPSGRNVSLGPGPLGGTIHWYVTDARGTVRPTAG